MKKPVQNLSRLLKLLLSICIFLFCFSTSSRAQSAPLPDGHPIKIAAPHLPLMVRYSGSGRIFYGDNNIKYLFENTDVTKTWATNYPSELAAYKVAIDKYLKETDVTLLANDQKDVYYDLKAQWAIISQL
jgi:hypothetical protein